MFFFVFSFFCFFACWFATQLGQRYCNTRVLASGPALLAASLLAPPVAVVVVMPAAADTVAKLFLRAAARCSMRATTWAYLLPPCLPMGFDQQVGKVMGEDMAATRTSKTATPWAFCDRLRGKTVVFDLSALLYSLLLRKQGATRPGTLHSVSVSTGVLLHTSRWFVC